MTKIILIGGASGTGKTTVATELCRKLGITHRITTGLIREIVKSSTGNKVLDSHTFSSIDKPPFVHLQEQSNLMKDAINACINRSSKEGTSLIIEGDHLIPGFIDNKNVTSTFLLYIKDGKKQTVRVSMKAYKRLSKEGKIIK